MDFIKLGSFMKFEIKIIFRFFIATYFHLHVDHLAVFVLEINVPSFRWLSWQLKYHVFSGAIRSLKVRGYDVCLIEPNLGVYLRSYFRADLYFRKIKDVRVSFFVSSVT